MKRQYRTGLLYLFIVVMLSACAGNSTRVKQEPIYSKKPVTEKQNNAKKTKITKPLSPYSTDGLIALNQFRSHNLALNDFLIRNRKPDYFFSGINDEFEYQTVYLVYLKSNNLYLFDPELPNDYKKFSPLPESIKESLKNVPTPTHTITAPRYSYSKPRKSNKKHNQQSTTIPILHEIEETLEDTAPAPILESAIIKSIGPNQNAALYPDLYYLDKPINNLLENEYSIKYEKSKGALKIIFPQSYEASEVYKSQKIETKKIFFSKNSKTGHEISLIVPDFLAGSNYYRGLRGNMKKAFSSLYQVKIPEKYSNSNELRVRFQIRLCQKDGFEHCSSNKGGKTYIRAIVIAATLYHAPSKTPIETFVIN